MRQKERKPSGSTGSREKMGLSIPCTQTLSLAKELPICAVWDRSAAVTWPTDELWVKHSPSAPGMSSCSCCVREGISISSSNYARLTKKKRKKKKKQREKKKSQFLEVGFLLLKSPILVLYVSHRASPTLQQQGGSAGSAIAGRLLPAFSVRADN